MKSFWMLVARLLFGMLLRDETLNPENWLGMALIIGGGVLSLRLSPKHPQKEGKP